MKLSRSKILMRFSEISTPNYKEVTEKKTAAVSQSPEDYMGAFWCKRKARKLQLAQWTLLVCKNENGRAYAMFTESNPIKMRISPIKLQGRMVVPRMVATSEKKCPAGVSERPCKAIKVHGLKILKTYKLCWRTLWTSLPTSTSLVFARLSSVFPKWTPCISSSMS